MANPTSKFFLPYQLIDIQQHTSATEQLFLPNNDISNQSQQNITMTTYSIYFENKYGSTRTYGFFTDPPIVSESATVYSNLLLSKSIAPGGYWQIDLTKDYWAYCGKLPSAIAPGMVVTGGNTKLIRLGTTSVKGTTCKMYNNSGDPAFYEDEEYNAPAGKYQIVTQGDFEAKQNFIIGLGAIDNNGRMKPAATLEAPRGSTVSIAPVTKFFMSSFTTSVGTVIDVSDITTQHAVIDFTKNPGLYGATVEHLSNGNFTVSYYATQFEYLAAVATIRAQDSPKAARIEELKALVAQFQLLLNADTNISNPYTCAITWRNNPNSGEKESIYKQLRKVMESADKGYIYWGDAQQPNDVFWIYYNAPAGLDLDDVVSDWTTAWSRLSQAQKNFCFEPAVREGLGLAADPKSVKKGQSYFSQKLGFRQSNGESNGVEV